MGRCTRPRPRRKQQSRWSIGRTHWSPACRPNSDSKETITMQFVRVTNITALFLLFGTLVPAYAKKKNNKQQHPQAQPQQQQAKQQPQAQPAQQQQQRAQQAQQPRPQQQQPQQQQQQQQRAQQAQQPRPQQQQQQQRAQQAQQPQRTQQQAVAWQQQRGWQQQGAWQGHSTWQQGRAQQWGSQHRDWAQRGGYGGYYIPQDRFNLYFGVDRWFRMHTLPTMYMGYPRFAYGGYSFLLVDPWPESWAENWFDSDDLYIAYDNGYYLYDRRYPGVGLAITVEL